MSTITKTYVEYNGVSTSYRATWTFIYTSGEMLTGVTASASTFTLPMPSANPTARYVYSGKNMGGADTQINTYVMSDGSGDSAGYIRYAYPASEWAYAVSGWSSGTTMTLPLSTSSTWNKNRVGTTSKVFNENNRNDITATLHYYVVEVTGASCKSELGNQENSFSDWTKFDIGTTVVITLDAPPDLSSATATSTSRNGVYWTADTQGLANSKIKITSLKTQYKAYFDSFEVYLDNTLIYSYGSYNATSASISASINSNISAGIYTPKVVVTDTRGQTSEKTFDPITIQQYVPATYNISQAQSSTDGFFANESAATITINNIVCPTGVVLEKAKLTIGNQVVEQALTGTETSITLSIPLDSAGTFTPVVDITDSRGIVEHNNLNSISVYDYSYPTATINAQRITLQSSSPVTIEPDEEGMSVLITSEFSFNSHVDFLEPTITANGENPHITWYETYSSGVLSDEINWSNYSPTSPVTIYGLSTSHGSTTGYDLSESFQIDITPQDSVHTGITMSATLPQAFFTVDFLAGGHGISFGQMAQQSGFWCWMEMYLRGVRMPTIFIEDSAPTSLDGENGDVWLQYQSYSITITQATGGTITASSNKGVDGQTITIEAEVDSGYTFTSWVVTGATVVDASTNPTTFVINGDDVTVTATYTAT